MTLQECQRQYDNMLPPEQQEYEPDYDNMSDSLYNWYLKQMELYN